MDTPFVWLHEVTFRYARERAPVFQDFSWEAGRGDAWAVIGPSGCGKSTLVYLLAGLRQPEAGQVQVAGAPVPRPRASTGLILQNHGLLPWATVRENAALGLHIGHFYRRKPAPVHLPRPYPPDLSLSEAEHWLGRLGLAGLADKYPSQLSGGQQQRVAIARTLALNPNLLLMDEPFSALDALTREGLQDLVVELQRELGVTTLVVTHNVEEAAYLGRRILVLHAPPHHAADMLENPGAGSPGFRSTPAFFDITRTLRGRLAGEETSR